MSLDSLQRPTGGGDGFPLGVYQGLEVSLTCRQGDFAEDLQKKECGQKRQGHLDAAIRNSHIKKASGRCFKMEHTANRDGKKVTPGGRESCLRPPLQKV